MRLYVRNLSNETTEDDLRKAFESFGQVRFVNIVRDGTTGESQGYGFVTMPLVREAQAAIEKMHGKVFNGQKVEVERARAQSEPQVRRPRRGGPGGRGDRRKGRRGGGFGGRGRGKRR